MAHRHSSAFTIEKIDVGDGAEEQYSFRSVHALAGLGEGTVLWIARHSVLDVFGDRLYLQVGLGLDNRQVTEELQNLVANGAIKRAL
jgi:hypothetical protein